MSIWHSYLRVQAGNPGWQKFAVGQTFSVQISQPRISPHTFANTDVCIYVIQNFKNCTIFEMFMILILNYTVFYAVQLYTVHVIQNFNTVLKCSDW